MGETKDCIFCYALDGQGAGAPIARDAATGHDGLVWLHLNTAQAGTKKFLKDGLGLDPLLIKPLVAEETRPRVETLPAGTLLILRGINFNPGPEPEDLVSIRLWISGNRIVSLGRRKSAAVAELDQRLQQGRGPRTAGEFVAMLCAALSDTIEPALSELEDDIDKLEEESLEAPDAGLRERLSDVRMQATTFRRYLVPQRDVIYRLQRPEEGWLSPADKWSVQESYDRATRFIETLEAVRERAQILQDELYSAQSGKLNRNLYILSVITVIFMPLTFLTGLLGMNVAGIPFAQHPYAFAAVCALSAVLSLVQLLVFRRLKWF